MGLVTDVIETDIPVLGAGGAGLCAALHAVDRSPGLSVTVAVKGLLGRAGCTRMVQGGYNAVLAALDSLEAHVLSPTEYGLEYTHLDLQPNYLSALSYDFNFADPDPAPDTAGSCSTAADCHGTAVAGVAAARGDNGIGVSGAAPLASLAGLRLIAAPVSDDQIAAAIGHEPDAIHINSNSWGPADDGRTLLGPGPLARAALETAVTTGRNGKGRIFTWAAGNGLQSQDNCNFDGFANTRFVIAVGALADTATQAFYSEPCAAMVVTAPSNGGLRGITTTDLTGSRGYDGSDYTSTFGGTSSATPLVAGVTALMLAQNPALTWRDVKEILVRSSVRINPGDTGWTTGPYAHNEKYGFGLVDGQAAVTLASGWTNLPAETAVTPVTRTLNLPIPDNDPSGLTDRITIGGLPAGFVVEHVEVEFDATHPYRGDLEVTLTSPAGVVSKLATVRSSDSGDDFPAWRFGSVRHWGESAAGAWTLKVADRAAFDVGTWKSWTLRIFGRTTGTFSITGQVTSGGSGLAGVTMSLSGVSTATTTTDAGGGYAFAGLANGNYTVTASKADCTFAPVNRAVTIAGSDVTGQSFTATCGGKDLVIEGLALSSGSVTAGGNVTASYSVKNQGTATVTETYTERIYLSTDTTRDGGDVLLATSPGHPEDLAPGAMRPQSEGVTIPAGTAAGSYYILVVADALGAVPEGNEANNVAAIPLTVTAPPAASDIILDNAAAGVQDGARTFTGTWCVSGATGFFGTNSLYSCGAGLDTYRWTPTIPAAGTYDVSVWWTAHVNRSTAVPIAVTHAVGTTTRTFNEQTGGGAWVLHGRYSFNAGTGSSVQVSDANGQAAADAVRFVPVSNPVPALTSLSPSSATAGGPAFTLTVNGGGFVAGSVVRWNGADRPTAYVSATQVTAAIPAGDIATAGTGSVTVFNPAPGGGPSSALTFTINPPAASEIILDNAAVGVQDGARTFTGTWCISGATGFFGTNSLYSCGAGPDTYRWTPAIPAAGTYDVSVWWTTHVNRSTAVPIAVTHAAGTTTRTFNEQTGGGAWVLHGRYSFNAGTGGFVQVSDANGQAAADAARFVPVAAPVLPTVTIAATTATATEAGPTPGVVTVSRTGSTAAALTVSYTVGGTATPGGDYAALSGSVTIPAGQATGTVTVVPIDDALVEPDETVVVTLGASVVYTVGTPASASVTIVSNDVAASEIILDNAAVGVQDGARTFTGTWCGSGATNFFGTDSLYSCGAGPDTYRWTPTIPAAGTYDVSVWWTTHVNRSTAVPIAVTHAAGTTTRTFNEQVGGGAWVLHGRYSFNAGTAGFVQVSDANGQAAADAARFVPVP